eukprot:TRINITY_DN13980_c0_g1_i1.p1 TRINITY_DN13980_c0_g1~~TRINITY_DN13980_c0_g1_i1.p1  ORF type:complete len:1558 (+),score=194.28 TRINITY_DN13980_c0_g1_i1:214-4674(+)
MVYKPLDESLPRVVPLSDVDKEVAFDFQRRYPSTQWEYSVTVAVSDPLLSFVVHEPSFCRGVYKQTNTVFSEGNVLATWSAIPNTTVPEAKCEFSRRTIDSDQAIWVIETDGFTLYRSEPCEGEIGYSSFEESLYLPCPPWRSGLWPPQVWISPHFDYRFIGDVDDPSQRMGALKCIYEYLLNRIYPSRVGSHVRSVNGAAYTPGFHENGYVETMVGVSVYIGIWCLSVHPAQSIYDEKSQGTRDLLRWCGASEVTYVFSHCIFTLLYSVIVIVPPAFYFGYDYLLCTTLCLYSLVCITSSMPSVVGEWRWMNHVFMLYSFSSFALMFLFGDTEWSFLLALNPSSAFLFAWPSHSGESCWGWNIDSETAKNFLVLDAIWCTLCTIYIVEVRPAEVDGQSWLFPLRSFASVFKGFRTASGQTLQSDPQAMKTLQPHVVHIENLVKKYPDSSTPALSKLTLSIQPGTIYALIGRNGAGKSTLINILTGQIAPHEYSCGKVHGLDIRTEMYKIKKDIGLCRQDDVLWDMLTPYQHIKLVSTMRGLPMDTSLLNELQLPLHKVAGELSGGMRRRLCIAMALVGNPKLVILDEPCASLDPIGRQHIWSLLRGHRDRGGTLLVTTQHVDEAATVGDYIGIISNGEMLCSSDVDTLENTHGSGQTVICSLHDHSMQSPEEILADVDIPGISSEVRGTSLYFRARNSSPDDICRLLSTLEVNPNVGHITLNTNWLEDLFMKLTSDPCQLDSQSVSRGGWSRVPDFALLPAAAGWHLFTQMFVVFQIRILPFKRSLSHVVQFSFALLILTVVMAGYVWDCTSGKFSFPQDAKLVVVTDDVPYQQEISSHLHRRDYMTMPISPESFRKAEIMACSLGFPGGAIYIHDMDSIVDGYPSKLNATLMWLPTRGWSAEYHMFSVEYLYTLSGISGKHVPSYSDDSQDPRTTAHSESLHFRLGTSLSTVVALLQTTAVLLTAFDVKSDLLHNLGLLGLKRVVFWPTVVAIDCIDAFITSIFYFGSLWIFGLRDSDSIFTAHSVVFICSVVLFGICSSLASRALTVTFAKKVTAQVLTSAMLMLTVVTSIFPLVLQQLTDAVFSDSYHFIGEFVSLLFPASILRVAVSNTNPSVPINWRIFRLTIMGFLLHIVLLSLLLWLCLESVTKKGKKVSNQKEGPDVITENQPTQSDWVAFDDVTMSYDGKSAAVSNVSFSLKPGECLGILGPNGAGKSTLINLITKLYLPSSGTVDIRQPIAVCPQHFTLWENLTGYEHIAAYLMIKYGKAIPQSDIKMWAVQTSDAVQLEGLGDKLVGNYTGGNKRKLQVILSLFSGADIILLDEPTAGMDPNSRVAVWDCIRTVTAKFQKSVVLTTHVMSEAEAICSRIAIVVDSKIRRMGSPVHLKRQYGKGFVITIQTSGDTNSANRIRSSFLALFPEAVELPGPTIRKSSSIKYSIPMCNVSQCFKIIHSRCADWEYKSFSVSQSVSLEQIFIEAAEAYGK